MDVINPELRELQQKYENLRTEFARMQGEVAQLKHTATDTTRQTIWQFVIFTVTMAMILLGGIKYQTDSLRVEMKVRFDAVDQRFEAVEKRIDQSEKNILTRFEDLKQEVHASRKQK